MAAERLEGLAAVLTAIRTGGGLTQPSLVGRVGLGRSVVGQRVAELEACGLVTGDGWGPSTGGRSPRRLRLQADAGRVLGVDISATELVVGVADLSGSLIETLQEPIDVARGPEVVMAAVERLCTSVVDRTASAEQLRAVGVGIPGPVEFRTGLPVAPPIMPGWDRYPVRDRLGILFDVPVWVDNDVNLLALGELRARPGVPETQNMVFARVGVGIGAGLVINGQLYRGVNGCAGDIGHVAIPDAGDAVCRCGKSGCLEAVAGGGALAREGRLLAQTGQSTALADVLQETGRVRPLDVAVAAGQGDLTAQGLLARSARLLGETFATLVSFYNPAVLVLGGGIVRAEDYVLPVIEETVRARALPLAVRDLDIVMSQVPEEVAGVIGAVHLALDQIFAAPQLARLLAAPSGTPATAG